MQVYAVSLFAITSILMQPNVLVHPARLCFACTCYSTHATAQNMPRGLLPCRPRRDLSCLPSPAPCYGLPSPGPLMKWDGCRTAWLGSVHAYAFHAHLLQVDACECVIVLLTRGVLNEVHTLLAVWRAITKDKPLLTVYVERGGYDYAYG